MNPTSTEITVRPNGGEVVRQEFGAVQTQAFHETAAAAVAKREESAVQARYIVARNQPRNIEQFRADLLQACLRPTFAEKVEYAKPVGKKWDPEKREQVQQYAFGPTIRFIETALQMFGNVYPEVLTVHESPAARICRVSVTDLQKNITYATEVVIQKTVERKGFKDRKTQEWQPPEGRTVLDMRLNSFNEPTFLVVATEDETLVKQNALLSKALRTNAQRLLPYDIVEEAILTAKATLQRHDAENPDAAKRRLLDSFMRLGVQPIDIEAFLGKSINKPLVPAEVEMLRALYTAIKDGETTWQAAIEAKESTGSEELQAEVKARKLAEAEAAKKNNGNPTQQTDGGTEEKQDAASGETGEIATQPGTDREIPPASTPGPDKPVFGRRK